MLWSSAASHVSADPAPPYGCYDSVEGLCHHAVPPCWPRRRCRAPARHALPVAPATMALRNCFPPPRPASKEFFGTALKRSEEHTSELQSLMRISYAVFCLKKKKKK